MSSRCLGLLAVVVMGLAVVANCPSQQLPGESLADAVRSRDHGRVMIAVESATEADLLGVHSSLVPVLIAIIQADQYPQTHPALRTLTKLKSRAAPAIPMLCKKLDDRRFWIRASAVETLVAIGEESVKPTRDLLKSESGLMRAGATEVLVRLKKLDSNDIQRLINDAEPRVRAALTGPLSHLGKPAVPQLVALLADPESAVGVAAAHALIVNREDPDMAIPALIQMIRRPTVGWAAANALAAYGNKAHAAIPALIKAYPLGYGNEERTYSFSDAVELALERLGSPHEDDVPAMCECLKLKDIKTQKMVLNCINRMGKQGNGCERAVESAVIAAMEDYKALRQIPPPKREYDRFDWQGKYQQAVLLAEEATVTLWHITRDDVRFLTSLESIATRTGEPIVMYQDSPWDLLGEVAFPQIEKMLRSPNIEVNRTAFHGVQLMGFNADPLRNRLKVLLDKIGDEARKETEEADNAPPPDDEEVEMTSALAKGNWEHLDESDRDSSHEFSRTTDFARRPDRFKPESIIVDWQPLERDALGHQCRVSAQLSFLDQGHIRPVNWFQGVTVFISARPGKTLYWSKVGRKRDVLARGGYVATSGMIELTLDLRRMDYRRDVEQDLQVGLALASQTRRPGFATQDEFQTLIWDAHAPAIGQTVRMLKLPPAPTLPRALELVNRVHRWPWANWDYFEPSAVDVIQAVNELRKLGKEEALLTLGKYVEMSEANGNFLDSEIVFWIIRNLFEPIQSGERIPQPAIPVFLVEHDSPDLPLWPLDPLELVNDIPFMPGVRIGGSGISTHPNDHIDWARRYGVLRTHPLVPTMGPLTAAESLISSRKFRTILGNEVPSDSRQIRAIRDQALATMPELFKPMPRWSKKYDDWYAELERHWKEQLALERKMQITWDPEAERFVVGAKAK